MEQILFERPREKLQSKGARFLTTTELLQIIIGSGSAKVSGARLAKRVALLAESRRLSLSTLLAIDGIGVARACQIIAALELGARQVTILPGTYSKEKSGETPHTNTVKKIMEGQRKRVLLVNLFNGAHQKIQENLYPLSTNSPPALVVRKVCADSLLANARSIEIAIGYRKAALSPLIEDLSVIKTLKESLKSLQIDLTAIYMANKDSAERWKG